MESTGGCTRKWDIASTRKQQPNVDPALSSGDDRLDDFAVGKEVSVCDVDAFPRGSECLDVAPTQPPPPTEGGKVDVQGAVDWAASLATDCLAQVRALRPSDLECEIGSARAPARANVLVADIDPAEECHFVVDEQDLALSTRRLTNQKSSRISRATTDRPRSFSPPIAGATGSASWYQSYRNPWPRCSRCTRCSATRNGRIFLVPCYLPAMLPRSHQNRGAKWRSPSDSARLTESVDYCWRFLVGDADVQKALTKLVSILEHDDVPYAIIGALALNEYGYKRVTVDVDLSSYARRTSRLSRSAG